MTKSNTKNRTLLIIFGALSAVFVFVYFILYTLPGSEFAARRVIDGIVDHEDMTYQDLEGNLANGMTIVNLDLKDIKDFPEGTTLKAQKIFLNAAALSLSGITVEVDNLRLQLPDSDLIVVSGTFKEGRLDFNIYSKGFTVNEVLSYLPDLKALVPIKGEVNDIDLFVTGDYFEPTVKGDLVINKFVYKGFLLTKAPLNVQFRLKDVKDDVKLFGNVTLQRGELQTKRTLVKLEESHLKFSGPWDQPQMNVMGSSKVERVRIAIALRGTPQKPELMLSSEPPHAKQRLMVMLATGKSWRSVEDSADGTLSSAALTKDFIDYFFFAGKSNQFAKRFGISDFSLTYNQDQKGVAAKKELSDNLEIGYGIEQTKTNGQVANVAQTMEGEYKVTNQVSVGVQREMTTKQANDVLDEQVSQNNDKVLLKYKKSF